MKKRPARTLKTKYDLLLIFSVPLIWYILFQYVPIYGLQIAFRDFNPSLSVTGSPFVGFQYFEQFFNSYYFFSLILNTLRLSLSQLIIGFPIPIILALLINEIRSGKLKLITQNITYIPHFLSVVVIVSMLNIFLNQDYGSVNKLMGLFGKPAVDYMSKPEAFTGIYVMSNVWQNMGWDAIIYIAALAGIDPSLYEAAIMDGATRMQKIRYISLPSISPTIIILLIMAVGTIMNVGYEKVLLMQNPVNSQTSEIISTFIYKNGIQTGDFSYAAAVGMFNSVVNFILLGLANFISKKITDTSLW